MGYNDGYISKKPEKCMSCKAMLCVEQNATHWCPILTDAHKKKKEVQKNGTTNK